MNMPGDVCANLTKQLNRDDLIQYSVAPDLTLKDLNITDVACISR